MLESIMVRIEEVEFNTNLLREAVTLAVDIPDLHQARLVMKLANISDDLATLATQTESQASLPAPRRRAS